MDHITLLQSALEMLLDGDQAEAAHALRSLAEELEDGASVEPAEVWRTLSSLVSSGL